MFFPDYSKRDFEIVDYQFYNLPQYPDIGFRGPRVPEEMLASGEYFSTLGGAQAVGVYIEKPYTALLAARIGLAGLNLGLGGANPDFYANQPALLDYVNRGRFLILQVMTARSEGNSRLQPAGVRLVRDTQSGVTETTVAAWARLLTEERSKLPQYVQESVASWRAAYKRLLAQMTVPVLLFYFSYKPDDEVVNFQADTLYDFLGTFPQFVDRASVSEIAALADGYAESRSRRNMGHVLRSRFTGQPAQVDYAAIHPSVPHQIETHNNDYPSPEMHADAADALDAALRSREWLGSRRRR